MRAGRAATASPIPTAAWHEAAAFTVAIFYVPRIAPEEWERFKALITPCPAESYESWLAFQAKEIEEIRASGHSAKLIEVGAADYARYRAQRRGKRDLEGLRGYVFEKATGKRY
jgi:hypothetical protein